MAFRRGSGERPARRGTPSDLLVVGLGNPGKEYDRTRHNVGAEVVARLAAARGASLKPGKERALVAEVRIGEARVALAFPTTYMNESGDAVQRLVRRYGIDDWSKLVVVHDELDLPPGTVRVKAGGGLAGNNGLRSISQHLKTNDYLRVRIGIGKPPSKERGADHVLSRLGKRERELLDESIVVAGEAVELIATDGIDAAMRATNGK
jgi:PTH1 family peptidyl-tRNA hydrolase